MFGLGGSAGVHFVYEIQREPAAILGGAATRLVVVSAMGLFALLARRNRFLLSVNACVCSRMEPLRCAGMTPKPCLSSTVAIGLAARDPCARGGSGGVPQV